MKTQTAKTIAAVVSLVVAGVSFTLSYLKYSHFNPTCFDLTYFHFFQSSMVPSLMKTGEVNPYFLMALVMTPVTIMFGFLHTLANTYLFLLSCLALCIGAILYSYFRLALEETASPEWSILLTVSMALNPLFILYSTAGYKGDFFGVLGILIALFNYKRQNRSLFKFGLVLAMFSKTENIPVCLLIAFWFRFIEKDDLFFKTTLKTVGGYFVFFLCLFITAYLLNPKFTQLPPAFDLATTPLSQPFLKMTLMMISNVLDPHSLKIFLVALPVLFLPLLAPVEFLLPPILQIGASMATWKWHVATPFIRDLIETSPGPASFYFDAPRLMYVMIPFVYFAAARGLSRFRRRVDSNRVQVIAAVLVLASSFLSFHFFTSPALGAWPGTAYWNSSHYLESGHTRQLRTELERLKKSQGKVVVSIPLEIYLPDKDTANPPYADVNGYSEALIDLYLCSAFPRREDVLAWVKKALQGPWSVISFRDGIIVLERGEPRETNDEVLRFIGRHESILEKCYLDFREYQRRIGSGDGVKTE